MSGFGFADLPLRAKASYASHAFKAAFKQHHKWLRPVFSRFIGADSVVFDVGGHSGQFAKLFAKIARQGHVYSFEPGAYPASILKLALAVNGLKNITIVTEGLGDAAGTMTLNTPLKARGTFRFGLAHMGGGGAGEDAAGLVHSEECKVTTIDLFAAGHGLERLDFIKLDIEGWEHRALAGGAETIRRLKPAMMIELVDSQLGRAGDNLETVWAELLSWGYRPKLCQGDGTLTPIDTPREGDIFWLPGEG